MRPKGKPFRWNMANPKLSKRLKSGDAQALPDYQQDRLLRCGASVLRAGDFDFVFVGRSLESIFDLVSGSLAKTRWYDRLQLLQLSLRGLETVHAIRESVSEKNSRFRFLSMQGRQPDDRLENFAAYLEFCRLLPRQILSRNRPVAFVDIVHRGTTYSALVDLLRYYCDSEQEWQNVKSRLHWVAVLPDPEKDEEPAWQPSDSAWTSEFAPSQIHQVKMNTDLWCYLADIQFKTTNYHPPSSWGSPANAEAPDWAWLLFAARGSRELYRHGERSRIRLAALLDEAPEPCGGITWLAKELRLEARNW